MESIPDTNFSDPNVLSLFGSYQTDGYPAKQITLKGGNGVADFVQSPAFYFDAQQQPPHSSQILADGSTSYTKVIPFQKHFHLHFEVTMINPVPPAFGPFGGTVFELHDTDPCFAQYGDPSKSAIRLDNINGTYTFYANDQPIWTGPLTLKVKDRFELNGVLQENNLHNNDAQTGAEKKRCRSGYINWAKYPQHDPNLSYEPRHAANTQRPTAPPPHLRTSCPPWSARCHRPRSKPTQGNNRGLHR